MMGFKNLLVKTVVLLIFLSNIVFATNINTTADNYITGMTVTRTYSGSYNVRIKLKNDTDKRYKLQDIGNNSYSLVLPQVKSLISEDDIFYENNHSDIKIVFFEKSDLNDKNSFLTKINFKTQKGTNLRVEAYAPLNSTPQKTNKKVVKNEPIQQKKSVPNWIWYISIGILSSLCLIIIAKAGSEEKYKKQKTKRINTEKTSIISTDRLFPWNKNIQEKTNEENSNNTIRNYVEQNNLNTESNNELSEDDEIDNIIDKLVQIVIPKNDLVLMPGVPELPGLEKIKKDETPKVILNNVKIEIDNNNKNILDEIILMQNSPEKMTLSDRIKNKENTQETEEVISNEKTTFFENISPIKEIPETISEDNTDDKEEKDDKQESDYDILLAEFKKILTVAHKIKDYEKPEEIDVIDAFAVSDSVGFSLVKYGKYISLLGNIQAKVFLIKTFKPEELDDETLFMEFCTQTPESATYSVILNKFKALIKITERDISLIGEYD